LNFLHTNIFAIHPNLLGNNIFYIYLNLLHNNFFPYTNPPP
jgi:hypothetical protein